MFAAPLPLRSKWVESRAAVSAGAARGDNTGETGSSFGAGSGIAAAKYPGSAFATVCVSVS
jgi:hypothetical protein